MIRQMKETTVNKGYSLTKSVATLYPLKSKFMLSGSGPVPNGPSVNGWLPMDASDRRSPSTTTYSDILPPGTPTKYVWWDDRTGQVYGDAPAPLLVGNSSGSQKAASPNSTVSGSKLQGSGSPTLNLSSAQQAAKSLTKKKVA